MARLMLTVPVTYRVDFHWGSRHDMCRGFEEGKLKDRAWIEKHNAVGSPNYKLGMMRTCDLVQAYICDDCFEKHINLFEGYDKEKQTLMHKKIM